MRPRRLVLAISTAVLALSAALAALWAARTEIAGNAAEYYFRRHGVPASIHVESLGLWHVSARFALGPQAAPDAAAERIELMFDSSRWLPYLTEVRLIRPLVRARVTAGGKVSLGSLQSLVNSAAGQSGGRSPYVSDKLAVSLTGLRALLDTPAGALEVDGDVKLSRNRPVAARLVARPAKISWRGISVALRDACLRYDGSDLSLAFSGDVKAGAFGARGLDALAQVSHLRWSGGGVSAASAHVSARAAAVDAGMGLNQARVEIALENPGMTGGSAHADVSLAASGDPRLDTAWAGVRDPRMRSALKHDLTHLRLDGAAHLERSGDILSLRLARPLTMEGANGFEFRVAEFSASKSPRGVEAAFETRLKGGGMPAVRIGATGLTWTGGKIAANVTVGAQFSYSMLRGAALSAEAHLAWQNGHYAFLPQSCLRFSAGAFHPATSDLARNIRATFCPGNAPLLSGQGSQWKLSGLARGVTALLPLADAQLDDAAARLDFAGQGGDFGGKVTVLAARLSDRAAHARFQPLGATGSMALAKGMWRGQMTVIHGGKDVLGTVRFDHEMASGVGIAHIEVPHLVFAQNGLQPEQLSPLLAQFRQAGGMVGFQGEVGWTRGAIRSSGTLSVKNLDFLTPLGRAHGLKTSLAFTSLLPPTTANGQEVTISRIDWTLPFSNVDLRFSFNSQAARIDALTAGWAEGHVALGPLTIKLADPSDIAGSAHLTSISLDSLIAASNLASKIKLTGKVSGIIPFAASPQNIHIAGGHIAADGAGRLSVDPSLWGEGGGAPAGNAVQNFAYQAMENLAFDQMTADLNSIPGGRLQIVFHIKGRSDPPKPQIARIAIPDLLNGTAFQKPIALPSGTPIDLTLDTSLNFDELLKSYAEAWSKSLGARETGMGAKP